MTDQGAAPDRGPGWMIVAVVAGLILLSGIYPLVAEPDDRLMGALVVVTSAIALLVAIRPTWRSASNAWMVMWLYPIALALIAAFMLEETFQIIFYVAAALAALGLWFSRPTS